MDKVILVICIWLMHLQTFKTTFLYEAISRKEDARNIFLLQTNDKYKSGYKHFLYSFILRFAIETTIHYLFRCRLYSVQRVELLDGVYKLDSTPQNSSEDQLLTVIFYGSEKYALNVNKEVLRLTIRYVKSSERFV